MKFPDFPFIFPDRTTNVIRVKIQYTLPTYCKKSHIKINVDHFWKQEELNCTKIIHKEFSTCKTVYQKAMLTVLRNMLVVKTLSVILYTCLLIMVYTSIYISTVQDHSLVQLPPTLALSSPLKWGYGSIAAEIFFLLFIIILVHSGAF